MKGQDSMQTKIREEADIHLRAIGVSDEVDGFEYLKEAIVIAVKNPEFLMKSTKEIYNAVATKFNTTYQRTERLMRRAIYTAYYPEEDTLATWDYFGNTVSPKKEAPSNLEFIAAIKEVMIRQTPNMEIASDYLREIGISPRLNGYQYLKMGIAIALEDHTIIEKGPSQLYDKLAEIFSRKNNVLEKSMSDAIKKAYQNRGLLEMEKQFNGAFHYSMPTSFELIKWVTNKIIEVMSKE